MLDPEFFRDAAFRLFALQLFMAGNFLLLYGGPVTWNAAYAAMFFAAAAASLLIRIPGAHPTDEMRLAVRGFEIAALISAAIFLPLLVFAPSWAGVAGLASMLLSELGASQNVEVTLRAATLSGATGTGASGQLDGEDGRTACVGEGLVGDGVQ